MNELPKGTVTLLMTDVEGSTRQWEAHAKSMQKAMDRHNEILHAAVGRAGGSRPEEQGEGDSVLAAFARASDAVACALDIQRALKRESWPLETPIRVRIGIHTGEVELRGERNYYGPALNRGARLRALAHGGQTLVSLTTEQLVRGSLPEGAHLRDLGPQRLKDLSLPERVFQLNHPDLPGDFPPPLSMESLPNNLPVQLTSLVGRENEMNEVRHLIATSRLVTLTGAAGCGKTRLAVQVAADLVDEFEDGVWFVDLAAITDPTLVPHTTAGALSVQEESHRSVLETLIDHLRGRNLLLILDNCEHLLAACTDLAQALLKSCPNLAIMATSREPLGVGGETSWRVPSLSVPGPNGQTSSDELIDLAGPRLFIERALAVASDFRIDRDEATAVGQICRRLDGMPLAIELAAAHVDVLTCEQIASMLDDQFRILTGGARTALERQQTMRAAVEWSYELLSDAERAVLNRLSVFVGGFSLEAGEDVCAGGTIESSHVFDLLTSLVRKSLVTSERRPHAHRYRLLETIKQYARDRLRESGEGAEVRIRHRDWCLSLAERAESELWEGGQQTEWLARLEEEHDNLRAALEWSASDEDPEPVARLAAALTRFWYVRGYAGEGGRWFARALERGESFPPALRAKTLDGAGWLAWARHDHKAAIPLLEEALSTRKEIGDEKGVAETLNVLGNVRSSLGDSREARDFWEESLHIRRRIGDKRGAAAVLGNLAGLTAAEGYFEQAMKSYEEALAINREVGDRHNEAMMLFAVGNIWNAQDENATARSYYEQALASARELGARQLISYCLGLIGGIAFTQGDYDSARTLWEELAEISRETEQVWGETLTLGALAYLDENYAEGRTLCERAAAVSRESGEQGSVVFSLLWAAYCAEGQGDLEGAKAYLEEAISISRRLPGGGERSELIVLGRLAQEERDYKRAAEHAREALPIAREHRDRQGTAFCLQGLAAASQGLGELGRAAQLYGAAERLLEEIGQQIFPHMQAGYEQSVRALRDALGAETFEKEWVEGRSMSLDAALELASASSS